MKWSGQLLSAGTNAKTRKGDDKWFTAIMYMSPGDSDICPFALKAMCKDPCLNTAGRGATPVVQKSRANKTAWFRSNKNSFVLAIKDDINKFVKYCNKKGVKPAVRLNGTSDIQWEKFGIPQEYPDVQFYDYTKIPNRKPLSNYHITWSYSNADPSYAKHLDGVMARGINAAVVFSDGKFGTLPGWFNNYPVLDGDKNDLRFLDPTGHIVGLKAKGKARKDTSGFVI